MAGLCFFIIYIDLSRLAEYHQISGVLRFPENEIQFRYIDIIYKNLLGSLLALISMSEAN